jgi:flavin reductase (DIM6/NTAB) family NADH-FMN oxidoreductase RutF
MQIQNFSTQDFSLWDRFYRAHFFNSLSGFKSLTLVGTLNLQGQPNLALFSNIVHLGADPALVGFINRPLAAASHTLSNLEATGSFTCNLVPAGLEEKAHQTSAKYASDQDEFDAVGLQHQWEEGIQAPFVKESFVKYALEWVETIPIRHNGTFLVIGQVVKVLVPQNLVGKDGFINLTKAATMTSLGIDGYSLPGPLSRYAYAKPDRPVEILRL